MNPDDGRVYTVPPLPPEIPGARDGARRWPQQEALSSQTSGRDAGCREHAAPSPRRRQDSRLQGRRGRNSPFALFHLPWAATRPVRSGARWPGTPRRMQAPAAPSLCPATALRGGCLLRGSLPQALQAEPHWEESKEGFTPSRAGAALLLPHLQHWLPSGHPGPWSCLGPADVPRSQLAPRGLGQRQPRPPPAEVRDGRPRQE